MVTEMTTTSGNPVLIQAVLDKVKTIQGGDRVYYSLTEAIELRDFLIQLNLGEEGK